MLVSIIIPVYNAEKYIARCIDSILSQSYRQIELIIVDDGSSDKSGSICEEYVSKDNRVRTIHQKNKGVSVARNVGLACAKGEWIAFVDSDDQVNDLYIENLIKWNEYDWVIGGYFTSEQQLIKLEQKVFTLSDLPDFFVRHFHRLYSTVPWGKLYRRDIILNNKLNFDKCIRLGEDLIFNIQYLKWCRSVAVISESNYIYTNNGSCGERYALTFDEIAYTLNALQDKTKEMARIWEINLSCESSMKILISTYSITKILDGNGEKYYKLYKSCFPMEDKMSYWNDEICSPIKRSIRLLKEMLRQKQFNLSIQQIRKIHTNYKDLLGHVHYLRKSEKVLALFCRLYFI